MGHQELLWSIERALNQGMFWRDKMEGLQGVTPFALAYDMEVIISTEIGMPIVRTTIQEKKNNNRHLEMHLDWADKDHKAIAIQTTSYH